MKENYIIEDLEVFKNFDLGSFNDFMLAAKKARSINHWSTEFITNHPLVSNLDWAVKLAKPSVDKKNWITIWIMVPWFSTKKAQGQCCIYGYIGKNIQDLNKIMYIHGSNIIIPQEFANEIKNNQLFLKTLKIRLFENIKAEKAIYIEKWNYRGVYTDFDTEKYADESILNIKKNNIDITKNNKNVEDTIAYNKEKVDNAAIKKAEQDKKEAIKNAQYNTFIELANKYGKGQKWDWYSEYYRTFGPSHEDDYNGSGTLDFATVAWKLCKTEDTKQTEINIKKLASQPVGFKLEQKDELHHIRTIYIRNN